MKKYWITLSQIEGHIAMWAVRQSPYHAPDGILEVLKQFRASVHPEFDTNEMKEVDRDDVKSLLVALYRIPEFMAWNERKNGNQAPFGFVSRYCKEHPDNDFIDLDALTGNVVRSLISECEADK